MTGYNLRLIPSCSWLWVAGVSNSGDWIRATTDSIPFLTRVLVVGCDLSLFLHCGWLWDAADLRSSDSIQVTADSNLRQTRVPPTGIDLPLTYSLIYQVNLRTYSVKCIIFMVCFLPADFSYHWSRLWLLPQEPLRNLNKLEEAWRSFKTLAATDFSCRGRFELWRLIRDLRSIEYPQNFDPNTPW